MTGKKHATRSTATTFVITIAAIWVVVACLARTGIIPEETIVRYSLGGEGGTVPVQLLTYSFIHRTSDWFQLFRVLATSTLWVWGLSANAPDWFEGRAFVQVYSLATLAVGAICWTFARIIYPDAVFAGSWPVIGTMLGMTLACKPREKIAVWGPEIRNALRYLATNQPAVLGFVALAAIGLTCRGFWGCPPRYYMLAILSCSWFIWPVAACFKLQVSRVCMLWCAWLGSDFLAIWFLNEDVPVAFAVNIVVPLITGIAYGMIAKSVRGRVAVTAATPQT